MTAFIKLITHQDYKYLRTKFIIPVRDIDTNLLKYDMLNPIYTNIGSPSRSPSIKLYFFYFLYRKI